MTSFAVSPTGPLRAASDDLMPSTVSSGRAWPTSARAESPAASSRNSTEKP